MAIQETQLLRVGEIAPDALIVWLAMVQLSNPNNSVEAPQSELRKHVNSIAKGRRFKKEHVIECQEELIEKGLIPSKRKVHPFSGTSEEISERQAERIVEAAIQNYKRGLPDLNDEDVAEHARLAHLLVAFKSSLFCQKISRKTLKDNDGNAIIVDGSRKTYEAPEWSYGFAKKMLNNYGFDRIAEVVSHLYKQGYLNNLGHDGTIRGKKEAMTSYILAVLKGEKSIDHDSDSRWSV